MQGNTILTQALAIARRIIRRFSVSSLAMFALAIFTELPVLFVRLLIVVVVGGIAQELGGNLTPNLNWWWVSMLPTLWAIFALIDPIGAGWWWKQRMGGRSPSQRERLAYQDAIELLQSHSPSRLTLPKSWFVLDTPQPDAAVSGNTLMLSRGLLESDYLPAVIAHELGHLASPDGRLTAALNRLVIPKAPRVNPEHTEQRPAENSRNDSRNDRQNDSRDDGTRPYVPGDEAIDALILLAAGALKIAMFAVGGLGLRLTRPIWGLYWRGREYKADAYAANLGQADELADFLEAHALIHDHPVPYIWLTEHTHPPSELRIDRLRDAAEHGDRSSEPARTCQGNPYGAAYGGA